MTIIFVEGEGEDKGSGGSLPVMREGEGGKERRGACKEEHGMGSMGLMERTPALGIGIGIGIALMMMW